jgi:two-component system OmpR family response regulator
MGEAVVDLSRSQGRLLMVDDEPFLREAVATSLRFMGYEVTTAQDGDEALRLARAQRFDLILLDVTLPDTDGFEVLRRLRRDGSQVPVLFLTARDTAADRATGLALGGDYLTKPFGLAELADRIAAGLSRRDDPASGPGQSAGAA